MKRRFRFRLERLIELRRYREREWEMKLAKVNGECLHIERKIAETQTREAESIALSGKEESILTFRMALENYIKRLEYERADLRAELSEKRAELEDIMAKYLEAAKKRKVLEKLEQRKADDYYRAQKKEDIKLLNEISTRSRI